MATYHKRQSTIVNGQGVGLTLLKPLLQYSHSYLADELSAASEVLSAVEGRWPWIWVVDDDAPARERTVGVLSSSSEERW